MPKKYITTLKNLFGENYDQVQSTSATRKSVRQLRQTIIPNIIKIIENPSYFTSRMLSLPHFLSQLTDEQREQVLGGLSPKEINFLKSFHGENLDQEKHNFDFGTHKDKYYYILQKIKDNTENLFTIEIQLLNIIKAELLKTSDLTTIKTNLLKLEQFSYLQDDNSLLSLRELSMLLLSIAQNIQNHLHKTEILKISKEILVIYQDLFNKQFESYIETYTTNEHQRKEK